MTNQKDKLICETCNKNISRETCMCMFECKHVFCLNGDCIPFNNAVNNICTRCAEPTIVEKIKN